MVYNVMIRIISLLTAAFVAAFSFPAHAQTYPGLPNNVIDLAAQYGVLANNSTDNSTAIASAITAANATGNVTIRFPLGTTLAPTLASTISGNNIWLVCNGGPGDCILKGSANGVLTWNGNYGGTFNLGFDNGGAATNTTISCNGFQNQYINAFLGTGIGILWAANGAGCGSTVIDNAFGQVNTAAAPLFSNNQGNGLTIRNSFIYTTGTRGSVTAGRNVINIGAVGSVDSVQLWNNYFQIFDAGVVVATTNGNTTQNIFLNNNVFDGMNQGHHFTTASGGITTSVHLQDKWLGVWNTNCILFDGAGTAENIVFTGKTGNCGTGGFISTVSGTFRNVIIDGAQIDGANFAAGGGDGINIASGSYITVTGSRVGQVSSQNPTQPQNACKFGAVIDHLIFTANDCQGTVTNYSGMLTGTTTTFAHTNSKQRGNVGLPDSPDISTFANRPTNPATGMTWNFSDGLAANCADTTCTTFGTNVTGGSGALQLAVRWNGTNWTLIGK